MKKIGNFFVKSTLILCLLVTCQVGSAQTWDNMVSWLTSSRGIRALAVAAHPKDGADYSNATVISKSSTEVVIKITFPGIFGNYWDEYTIIKGTYNGKTYFKDITFREQKPDPVTGPFMNLNLPSYYRVLNHYNADMEDLYGGSLSRGEKGAFVILDAFLDYWQN